VAAAFPADGCAKEPPQLQRGIESICMATTLKLEPADSELTPELKAFIDGAIVPALVKAWLLEARQENPLALTRPDMDNASRAEEGVIA
jgi:hypothetical protein